MNKLIPIGFTEDDLLTRVNILAKRYHFVVNNEQLPRLNLTAERLELLMDGFSPLFVDFNGSTLQRRREAGKQQDLIRACKPVPGLKIFDITAGWGRDAALLASFGADVLMLERQPIMAALLDDALQRLANEALSLRLLHVEATTYLHHLHAEDCPDVIYIDPMHPERQKSALVKKDMQALQRLFGPDDDAKTLIELALHHAKKRVVVKWPQRLPALVKPTQSFAGKTVRFDRYDIS